jgi:hypothetical protein
MGVDVFTDESKTRMRAPEQVILDTLDATGGDMTKIGKLFGTRAKKAFEPFQEASVKAGGGKVGIEAVRKMLGGVTGATMSKEEIQESAAFRRGQSDRQFETAMAKFNDAIGKELLPTVTKLIPKFVELLPTLTKAAEAFGKFVEALAENPMSTIGKIIAVKVAADLAMAGIGAAVKGALVKAISGGGTGTGTGGAGTGGGMFGAGMAGATIGLTVGTAILTAGIVNFEADQALIKQAGSRVLEAEEAAARGDTETTRRLLGEAKQEAMSAAAPGTIESMAKAGLDLWSSPFRAFGGDDQSNQINRDLASRAAQFVGAKDPSTSRSLDAGVDRISKADDDAQRVAARLLQESAVALKDSATSLKDGGGPNRGTTPSPVK